MRITNRQLVRHDGQCNANIGVPATYSRVCQKRFGLLGRALRSDSHEAGAPAVFTRCRQLPPVHNAPGAIHSGPTCGKNT